MIAECLLDTDTLSALMRRDPAAQAHARAYVSEHATLTFSIISRYEVLRGLKAKRADIQEMAFESFCAANTVLPLDDSVIVGAASIYADLRQRGLSIGDADILIAATALSSGLILATHNTRHFAAIRELQCVDWLTS